MSKYRIEKAGKSAKGIEGEGAKALAKEGGLERLLQQAALGLAPAAQRMSPSSMTNAQFGGYAKGFTNQRGFKGTLNFTTLRQIGWRSPVLSAILSTRIHQAIRYCRPSSRTRKNEVGFKVVHKRHNDKNFKVPKAFADMCSEVEKMIEKPWQVYWEDGFVYREIEPNLAGFLAKACDDSLVINRPVIELGLDAARVPRAFGSIDGSNVLPTFQVMKYLASQTKDMPKDLTGNYLSYRTGLQMAADRYNLNIDERTEWLYLLDGKPSAAFRADEIIVAPFAPQSDIRTVGYPKSLTEKAIFIILAEIMAMTANSRYFEFGSMAEQLIALKGNYSDEHVKAIEEIFHANMSGVPGMFRVPLLALPGGADDVNVIPIKQNHKDMLFDIYIQKLTNLCCAIFRMHPSEINEAPRAGDNSGALSQSSQTKQISMAQEQGLETLLLHMKVSIFDPILERIDPNLMLEWDHGYNEQEQLAIQESYKGIATVNERRQMMGMDPLKKDDPRGEMIADPTVQSAMQQPEQQASGMPGEQPGPGGVSAGEDAGGGDEEPPADEQDEGDQGGRSSSGPWSPEDEQQARSIVASLKKRAASR